MLSEKGIEEANDYRKQYKKLAEELGEQINFVQGVLTGIVDEVPNEELKRMAEDPDDPFLQLKANYFLGKRSQDS